MFVGWEGVGLGRLLVVVVNVIFFFSLSPFHSIAIDLVPQDCETTYRTSEVTTHNTGTSHIYTYDRHVFLYSLVTQCHGVCAMVCHKVDRLEAELAAARAEVSDAVAASHRASARREEAEERRRRLNDSNLGLVREVRGTT